MNPMCGSPAEALRDSRPKADYIPILGTLLGVAVKSVTQPETPTSEENCGGAWLEPNKNTGKPEKHLYHIAKALGTDVRNDQEVALLFEHPVINPLRVTIHFNRNSAPMAAGRASEDKPFGLSLQDQHYLNLVYLSEEKPVGFEPLFIKVILRQKENPRYLRISLKEKKNSERAFLILTAVFVQESEAPAHLVACDISDPKRAARTEVNDSLRARYFKR